MSDNKKSTDPGLSAAERKAQRSREAQEAIADLERAQRSFQENRESLREERLRREEAAGAMLYPAPTATFQDETLRLVDGLAPVLEADAIGLQPPYDPRTASAGVYQGSRPAHSIFNRPQDGYVGTRVPG